jgi:hypothetical protein
MCFYIASIISYPQLQSITENIEYMIHLVVLLYTFFDIFMIMYFGNEIKISSDRLPYCLFQSDWYDQTESSKRSIIIFAELVKHPKELVIGKLYRLTLEAFTKVELYNPIVECDATFFSFFLQILNSAYCMFNILKSLKLE